MTNKEFIELMIITGKINVNSIRNIEYANEIYGSFNDMYSKLKSIVGNKYDSDIIKFLCKLINIKAHKEILRDMNEYILFLTELVDNDRLSNIIMWLIKNNELSIDNKVFKVIDYENIYGNYFKFNNTVYKIDMIMDGWGYPLQVNLMDKGTHIACEDVLGLEKDINTGKIDIIYKNRYRSDSKKYEICSSKVKLMFGV